MLSAEVNASIRAFLATLLLLEGDEVAEVITVEQVYTSSEQDRYALVLTNLLTSSSQSWLSAEGQIVQCCFPGLVGLLIGWQDGSKGGEESGWTLLLLQPCDLDALQQITSPLPPRQSLAPRLPEEVTALRQQEWAMCCRFLSPDVPCVPPVDRVFASVPVIRRGVSLLASLALFLSALPGFHLEGRVLIPHHQGMRPVSWHTGKASSTSPGRGCAAFGRPDRAGGGEMEGPAPRSAVEATMSCCYSSSVAPLQGAEGGDR